MNVNKAQSNKSMDVRAKQRLSYRGCPLNSNGLGGGFAPRHLKRWIASCKWKLAEYVIWNRILHSSSSLPQLRLV